MSRRDWVVLAVCLALAVIGYLAVGSPGMGGEPMAKRAKALDEKIRAAPETLTPAEALSRLQLTVRERPEDPQPHYFIGNMMRAQGRLDDAMRAYQSALRRDEAHVPALVGLADVMVEANDAGVIPADAMRLYGRAYELDRSQTDAGFLAGLGAWQAGDQETATQAWRVVLSNLDEGDPARAQIEKMIARVEQQ